jgi:ribosomal protein S3AE
VCRYYQFIEQFAVEVLREKFLSMDLSLTHHDYDVFFNRKSEWHKELDALSQSTRNKLRQILFRILVEAGLLSKNNSIIPAIITPRVAREIFKPSNSQAVIYPISDADLGGLLT